jgi:hypothetical protein
MAIRHVQVWGSLRNTAKPSVLPATVRSDQEIKSGSHSRRYPIVGRHFESHYRSAAQGTGAHPVLQGSYHRDTHNLTFDSFPLVADYHRVRLPLRSRTDCVSTSRKCRLTFQQSRPPPRFLFSMEGLNLSRSGLVASPPPVAAADFHVNREGMRHFNISFFISALLVTGCTTNKPV